jgi:hypothetical protein
VTAGPLLLDIGELAFGYVAGAHTAERNQYSTQWILILRHPMVRDCLVANCIVARIIGSAGDESAAEPGQRQGAALEATSAA